MANRGSPVGCRALRLAFFAATLTSGCNAVFGIHEGSPPPPCYDPSGLGLLIDDMEDGTGDICDLGGRKGGWYTVGDGTSTMLEPAGGSTFTPTAIPGGRGQSHQAARFTGSGFTGWGALMGFELDTQNLMNKPYDASSTDGIKFWMKNDVPVTVNFLIPQTVLLTAGGDCTANSTDPNCNSHFSFQIGAPNSDWVAYEVPFSALTQQFGGTATWNPQVLLGVQFLVAPGAAFDVWVDDVSFYRCTSSACKPTCNDPAFPVPCAASGSHPAACLLAGTDCSAIATWCSDLLLIDDMEDDNAAICNSGGRNGNWFTAADGTEGTLSPARGTTFTMTPIPGGRGKSHVAAHMTASGFTTWAQMDLTLGAVAGVAKPYDASATGGITFWMKTDAPHLEVELPTSQTVPVSRGGLCSDSATTDNCDNSFSFEITSPHPADWFQYYVPYSALLQGGLSSDANGNLIVGSATWDPTRLLAVNFNVNYPPPSFELWIDDVSFYDCSNETCLPTCTDPTAPVACPALGTTPANCWPAGTDCSTVTSLRWDAALASARGSGPDDVWAVGAKFQDRSAVAVHWDGTNWSSSATGSLQPLWDVWSSRKDDVWAVGDFGTIVHWNGAVWSPWATGTQDSLGAVWGSADNDIWVAGANGTILHFDGTVWSPSAEPSAKNLYRLWGSAQDDVWAVGDGGTILHYDGTSWSAKTSGTDSALWGVWGSSSTDVYAAGNTAIGDATILHWDGKAWASVSTPAAAYPNAVWGSGPDDVWVVGSEAIVHYDGKRWSVVPSPAGHYLWGVWGSGPVDAWIVGGGASILHWDGTVWSVVPTTGIR